MRGVTKLVWIVGALALAGLVPLVWLTLSGDDGGRGRRAGRAVMPGSLDPGQPRVEDEDPKDAATEEPIVEGPEPPAVDGEVRLGSGVSGAQPPRTVSGGFGNGGHVTIGNRVDEVKKGSRTIGGRVDEGHEGNVVAGGPTEGRTPGTEGGAAYDIVNGLEGLGTRDESTADVERFPHLDAPSSVRAGQEIAVQVMLTEDRLGTRTRIADGSTTPEGQLVFPMGGDAAWTLEVALSAEGFDFVSSNVAELELRRTGDSTPAMFRLAAREDAVGTSKLFATFWHRGRYLARVEREVRDPR